MEALIERAAIKLKKDAKPEASRDLDALDRFAPQDARLAEALIARCWNRALLNRGLSDAMDDCKRSLRLEPNSAAALDSLGLVYLRIHQFGQAIAQYDAALKINSKQSWSLYCRGVAKSHMGEPQEGAADISAAVALEPQVTERAKRAGVN